MANLWFTADTHLGHAKILTFEPKRMHFKSIEEHDETIISNWNSVVRKQDSVWHLGDVLFGAHSFELLKRLNGNKKLVMGNHDQYAVEKYLEAGFSKVFGAARLSDNLLLTHIPVHPNQFSRFRANIHGHSHSKVVWDSNDDGGRHADFPDPRYYCVSIEQHELSPVALDKIRADLTLRGIL